MNVILTHLSILLKSELCNNVKSIFTLEYILSHVLIIFSHALQKYTYFDVTTNILKHI